VIVDSKNSSKQNKTGQLRIKNYTFERVGIFKYVGVIRNEGNSHQTDLQEIIKNINKTYFMLQTFFRNKNISKN